ncbi:MAG: hypothetical protein QXI19_13575 [Candidatus Caldarchaeum sp.]
MPPVWSFQGFIANVFIWFLKTTAVDGLAAEGEARVKASSILLCSSPCFITQRREI